jgi:hypothetical protein
VPSAKSITKNAGKNTIAITSVGMNFRTTEH